MYRGMEEVHGLNCAYVYNMLKYNYNINILIDELQFEWDEDKNQKNVRKHGVRFEEAKTVFYDETAILFDDPDHSRDEDRFLLLGYSAGRKLCIVSHCYRESGSSIRIISARRATKAESSMYFEQF